MAVRECPRCRTVNDAGAQVCDCGYEFATGVMQSQRAVRDMSRSDRERVATTADRYRSLVLVAVAHAFLSVANRAVARTGPADPQEALGLTVVMLLALVVVAAAAASLAFRCATEMDVGSPSGWAVAVFLFGVIGLLFFSGKARQWSERYGMRFGLLGPNRNDVDRVAHGH